jgi:hypothetical protein
MPMEERGKGGGRLRMSTTDGPHLSTSGRGGGERSAGEGQWTGEKIGWTDGKNIGRAGPCGPSEVDGPEERKSGPRKKEKRKDEEGEEMG